MKSQNSFTLIELLVVIAIIGILAGIIIVSMTNATDQAIIAKAKVFSSSIKNSIGNNLISEWNFDEVSGTDIYDSTSAYPAILSNTTGDAVIPTRITNQNDCISGNCLEFNGNQGNVIINNNNAFKFTGGEQEISISMWAKTDKEEGIGFLISKGWNGSGLYNYRIAWDTDNHIKVVLTGNTSLIASSANKISKEKWNHYFLTISKSKAVKLYINSILEINTTHNITDWTPPLPDTNISLTIGNIYPHQQGSQYIFDGKIDEVRIYNSVIPIAQIKQQYLAGLHQLLAKNLTTKQDFDSRITELEYQNAIKSHE